MAKKLDEALPNLDSVDPAVRDYYVYDEDHEEWTLQVEPRALPRRLKNYGKRSAMSVDQKSRAISALGMNGYLSLPY